MSYASPAFIADGQPITVSKTNSSIAMVSCCFHVETLALTLSSSSQLVSLLASDLELHGQIRLPLGSIGHAEGSKVASWALRHS